MRNHCLSDRQHYIGSKFHYNFSQFERIICNFWGKNRRENGTCKGSSREKLKKKLTVISDSTSKTDESSF